MEWLWVRNPSVPRSLSFLVRWDCTTQTDLVHNLGILLDSQLLLEEQVEVGARRIFAQLHLVHPLWPFLDKQSLCSVTHTLIHSYLEYCNVLYMDLLLKSTWRL